MKVLVPVKRVVDYNIKIRIDEALSKVDLDGIKMSMNPFCEIAVEQAVKLKELKQVDEVIVVSIGELKVKEQLLHALAMGCDRAILVETGECLEPLNIAKILHSVAGTEKPDLILLGKQSIDGDNAQTGAMLSALMELPIANRASRIELEVGNATVHYEVDDGEAVVKMKLPAIATADLRLADPRFVKLPNIMKAKKKPLSIITVDALGLTTPIHQEKLAVTSPISRAGNTVIYESGELLAQKVKESLEESL